jgi:Helicase associated domain
VHGNAWEHGFAALTTFKAREGHFSAPIGHIEGTVKLGHWVNNQRSNKDNISVERRKRLDDIGFVWVPLASGWEEGFAALTMFKAREGHCHVSQRHIESAFKLGHWVNSQRSNKDTLSAERRKRLDEIGFVWRAR